MHSDFVGPEAPFLLVTNSNTFKFENLKRSESKPSERKTSESNTFSDKGYLDQIGCYFTIFTFFKASSKI